MKNNVLEVLFVFFKLGCLAFGGPVAHIAMMEVELVTKRKWMEHQQYLDFIGITHLIPGPNSTEVALHCGMHRAGWLGLLVSGVSFIFPSFVLTLLCAYFYDQYQSNVVLEDILDGIRVAVLAIIISVTYRLSKKAIKSQFLVLLVVAVTALCVMGTSKIVALFAGGILGTIWYKYIKVGTDKKFFYSVCLMLGGSFCLTKAVFAQIQNQFDYGLHQIFWAFFKVGSVLFGSGYVLVAYLQTDMVDRMGWITQSQLLDAIAVGQFLPGPVLTAATFVGYLLGGVKGALVATVGIFLPAFIFVAVLNPVVKKMRSSKLFSTFLDCINASVIGLLLAVIYSMSKEVVYTASAFFFLFVSLLLLIRFRWNVAYVVILGGVFGYLTNFLKI